MSPAQLDSPPFLRAERPERSRVEASLDRLGVDRSKPLLAVVASRQNDPRSWPLDTAARLVASSATSAFLLAGPAEADLDLESAGVRVLRQGAAIADLVALGALIAESRGAVVGNDRGATHVLRAAGARTVFLFGPQDPLRTGPLRGEVLVSRDSLACRPCLARTCHHRDGPVCMSRIPVEDVLEVLG